MLSRSNTQHSAPKSRLALTAQLACATTVAPWSQTHAALRESLVNGICWLQEPSGVFLSAFPPARRVRRDPLGAALALTALARAYELKPAEPILEAFSRIAANGRSDGGGDDEVARTALTAEAFARMSASSHRPDFARHAFTLADRLVDRQLTVRNSPHPELRGGFISTDDALPDIASALALAALVRTASAARRFNEPRRAQKYEAAAHRAARFVLQLQMKPAEAYYIPNHADAVGGVRVSPADSRIRLENLQYALIGLLEYRGAVSKRP